MKTLQITISVPEDFESIDTLETYVNQTGQRIKQPLFSSMLESMIDKEKPQAKALQSCPACQKKQRLDWKPSEEAFNGLWTCEL